MTIRAAMTRHDDDLLDEALEETFPASDPIAVTPERVDIYDNPVTHRFETLVDGLLAHLRYMRGDETLTLVHTEVPSALEGRGVGGRLVTHAMGVAAREGRKVIVICPYATRFLQKHPEFSGLMKR